MNICLNGCTYPPEPAGLGTKYKALGPCFMETTKPHNEAFLNICWRTITTAWGVPLLAKTRFNALVWWTLPQASNASFNSIFISFPVSINNPLFSEYLNSFHSITDCHHSRSLVSYSLRINLNLSPQWTYGLGNELEGNWARMWGISFYLLRNKISVCLALR